MRPPRTPPPRTAGWRPQSLRRGHHLPSCCSQSIGKRRVIRRMRFRGQGCTPQVCVWVCRAVRHSAILPRARYENSSPRSREDPHVSSACIISGTLGIPGSAPHACPSGTALHPDHCRERRDNLLWGLARELQIRCVRTELGFFAPANGSILCDPHVFPLLLIPQILNTPWPARCERSTSPSLPSA